MGTKLEGVFICGPFDNCMICETDFKGSMNAVIDVDKIYNKNLYKTKLSDTIVIGSFDDALIRGADFTGVYSDITINPQNIRSKTLENTILN